MFFTIVIEPRALADIQNGIDYYEKQLLGLGERFSETVDHYIKSISANPFYQIRHKDYRALATGKFPYLIAFYVNEESQTVFIMAVFHTSQNPKKLLK
jgi:toxin ParE1/3/4